MCICILHTHTHTHTRARANTHTNVAGDFEQSMEHASENLENSHDTNSDYRSTVNPKP